MQLAGASALPEAHTCAQCKNRFPSRIAFFRHCFGEHWMSVSCATRYDKWLVKVIRLQLASSVPHAGFFAGLGEALQLWHLGALGAARSLPLVERRKLADVLQQLLRAPDSWLSSRWERLREILDPGAKYRGLPLDFAVCPWQSTNALEVTPGSWAIPDAPACTACGKQFTSRMQLFLHCMHTQARCAGIHAPWLGEVVSWQLAQETPHPGFLSGLGEALQLRAPGARDAVLLLRFSERRTLSRMLQQLLKAPSTWDMPRWEHVVMLLQSGFMDC